MDPQTWHAQDYTQHYIADYKPFNFVDGIGVRHSIYVSGCLFRCPGCFNQAAQRFDYGRVFTDQDLEQILTDCAHEAVAGITLLGGEPFLNTPVCLKIVQALRQHYGTTKTIWAYSGYTFEQLYADQEDKHELLTYLDVLVDGPFELQKRDLTLAFRGSSNQRILDIPASLAHQQAIELKEV